MNNSAHKINAFVRPCKFVMKKISLFLFIKFILAFCSIVYELVLAQALSAFLGNTVLRYSITIGLYLLCMGIGSILAEGKFIKDSIKTLLWVEVFLTLFGGFSLAWFFFMDALNFSRILFLFGSHFLIIVIGILTGFEIPLLIERVNRERKNSEGIVLAFDYAGAFVGSIMFALVFYSKMGLVPTAFFVGMLNAACGMILFLEWAKFQKTIFKRNLFCFGFQSFLLAVTIFCLIHAAKINAGLISLYLS